jgi:hypothetical protein
MVVISVKVIYHFNRFHLAYANDLMDAVGLMEGHPSHSLWLGLAV